VSRRSSKNSPASHLEPNFVECVPGSTGSLCRGCRHCSHSEYVEGQSLLDMVREDLVAERIAVESYNDIIKYLGDDDPTTRIAIEKILAKEEEHADDMKKILDLLSKDERTAGHV